MESERPKYAIPGIITIAGLVAAVGSIILWAWFASEVGEGETLAFDVSIRDWIHSFSTPILTEAMRFISMLASPVSIIVMIIGTLAYLALSRRRRHQVILLVAAMTGEVVLDLSLKAAYSRVRPEPYFDYPLPSSFSFPSGHSLGAFCFFGCLCWLLILGGASRWRVALAIVAASLFVLLVGISRVYLGVHYPTDVLAGYSAGAIWLSALVLANWSIRARRERADELPGVNQHHE